MSNLNRTKVRRESTSTMPSALPLGEIAFNSETSELFVGTGTGKAKVTDPELLQKYKDLNNSTSQSLNQLSSQLDTIANKGTTVDVLERVTKEEIERQINDGTIANLTIEDNSITNDKYKEKSISINKVDFINYSETTTGNLIDETLFKGKKFQSWKDL